MKHLLRAALALAVLGLSLAAGAVAIETVPVGDINNLGELSGSSVGGYGPTVVCGSVGYPYRIGKYEVTAGQYTAFLNAVAAADTYALYNANMSSSEFGCKIQRSGEPGSYTYSVAADFANRPVNYVSYWDACRFANWLHNGQPKGAQTTATTEHGAYALFGYNGDDGRTIRRNMNVRWAVTSEDEWYKAAYYKRGGTTAGYWDYPMQSNTTTLPQNAVTNPDGGNNACFNQGGWSIGAPYYRTEVGEFENSESAYGTFDQGGNVREWNEAVMYSGSGHRGARGGPYNGGATEMQASCRYIANCLPTLETRETGFRVSSAVPEPGSWVVLTAGLAGLVGFRRRR